jgi:cysteine desulfurase / selenocysteine lyase
MGFESAEEPLWERYRDQFPVTERLIYLNHAAVAPLAKPAAEAMKRLAEDVLLYGSAHYNEWLEAYGGFRAAAAKLISAQADEIAVVKNTSEGIAAIASGMRWKPGDRIVAFQEEFPANYLPWLRLETLGVRITWLSATDPLDRIDEAVRGARLLTISFVQYLTGYRANLEALGEICERHGCLFFCDAIQGLGAFPLDVRRSKMHALSADGHKWLLGPEGCGILYVRRDIQDAVEPVELGWTNFARFADYAARDLKLRPSAARYECGTLNTIGVFGLRASIDLLLEVGVERIAPAVQALGDRIAEGVKARGYEVLGERTAETGAGIVSFRKQGLEAHNLVHDLRARGIICAPRQGWVRASPHFYIAPHDIDQMLEWLP